MKDQTSCRAVEGAMNSSGKATPGPWEIVIEFGFPRVVAPNSGVHVADTVMDGGKASGRQAEVAANARLIKAAPDLLDALRSIMEWASNQPMPFELSNTARLVIARAEGRDA